MKLKSVVFVSGLAFAVIVALLLAILASVANRPPYNPFGSSRFEQSYDEVRNSTYYSAKLCLSDQKIPGDRVQVVYEAWTDGSPTLLKDGEKLGSCSRRINIMYGSRNPRLEYDVVGDMRWLIDGNRPKSPTVKDMAFGSVVKLSVDGVPGTYQLTQQDKDVLKEFISYKW